MILIFSCVLNYKFDTFMKNSPDNALIEKSLLDVNKLLKQIIAKIKKSLNNSDFEEMWINFSKLRFYMNNVNELLEIKKI